MLSSREDINNLKINFWKEVLIEPWEISSQFSPINSDQPIKVTFFGDMIEDLYFMDQDTGKIAEELDECELFPMEFKEGRGILASHLPADTLLVADELELKETDYTLDGISPEKEFEKLEKGTTFLRLTSFPEAENFFHIRYLSFLKYYTQADFE